MVPLIINPIYTLYSGYWLGISPFKGLFGGVKQLGALHPKGFPTIFPMTMTINQLITLLQSESLVEWHVDVSKNRGTQNGCFIMENPIKMGWFGGTIIFGNTHVNDRNIFKWKSPRVEVLSFPFPQIWSFFPRFKKVETTTWGFEHVGFLVILLARWSFCSHASIQWISGDEIG